jgi:hypothetical protein
MSLTWEHRSDLDMVNRHIERRRRKKQAWWRIFRLPDFGDM